MCTFFSARNFSKLCICVYKIHFCYVCMNDLYVCVCLCTWIISRYTIAVIRIHTHTSYQLFQCMMKREREREIARSRAEPNRIKPKVKLVKNILACVFAIAFSFIVATMDIVCVHTTEVDKFIVHDSSSLSLTLFSVSLCILLISIQHTTMFYLYIYCGLLVSKKVTLCIVCIE